MPAPHLPGSTGRSDGQGLGHAMHAGWTLLALCKRVGVGGGGKGLQRCFQCDPVEMLSISPGMQGAP